jgi:hypothetical protein
MKRVFAMAMVVAIFTVFLVALDAGTVRGQEKDLTRGGAQDQPAAPSGWQVQADQAKQMISEAQRMIQLCNEQIARAEAMKKQAQEGRARAQRLGGTRQDQPEYPWINMEKMADQQIADAKATIERCELQIKTGKVMQEGAENEIKKMGQ